MRLCSVLGLVFTVGICGGLENGLARTPPMGWLSWSIFWCEIDCEKHPSTCVSEKQIMEIADRMAQDGYKDAGYKVVAVDDCWFASERDEQGKLQADPVRFSKGIKWLADYVHKLGLHFGIYEDEGEKTCAGYPGTLNYEDMDAETFASWGVDYVKLDGCNVNPEQMNKGFPLFRDALNKTGLPIVYSCEWPVYMQQYGLQPDYTAVKNTCNLWRNWDDIALSWKSLLSIIDYIDSNQDTLAQVHGPGAWNDPDMLIIGNGDALTVDQSRLQMAIWSIWSAPLIMSVDLRTIQEPFKAILLNKDVIAVDQDPLGKMGKAVVKNGNTTIYAKPMTPVDPQSGDHSFALAFMNRGEEQETVTVPALTQLGLKHAKGYVLKNLFDSEPTKIVDPNDSFSTTVNPTGVTMFKATIVN